MKYFFSYFKFILVAAFLFLGPNLQAQFYKDLFVQNKGGGETFNNKEKDALLVDLHADVRYLASGKLEGRHTGTYGEQLAGMYIQRRMEQAGLGAYGSSFRHIFKFVTGRQITPESRLTLGGKFVFLPEEVFPLPFSSPGEDQNFVLPNTRELYSPWIIPLYQSVSEANDPGFDWRASTYARAKHAESRGATSVVFYDNFGSGYVPKYAADAFLEPLAIPVLIMGKKAYDEHLKDLSVMTPFALTLKFKNTTQQGSNVIGYVDNSAPLSVIIGAHYDYLGKNAPAASGNDGNASGVAALLALAGQVKSSGLKKYNYIFVAFSGAEQGLVGSKGFVSSKSFNPRGIAFMVNLDNVGVPNAAHDLYVGGLESSVSWKEALKGIKSSFKIVKEPLSGLGDSDYLPFYEDSIPVLFFTTAQNVEQRKTRDRLQSINYPSLLDVVQYVYQALANMDQKPVPRFGHSALPEPINAPAVASIAAKEPFGISPDDSYKSIGVRIGKIAEGSSAFNAKMKPGDIILQVGKLKINGLDDYQKSISALNTGAKATITIKRGPTVQKFQLIF